MTRTRLADNIKSCYDPRASMNTTSATWILSGGGVTKKGEKTSLCYAAKAKEKNPLCRPLQSTCSKTNLHEYTAPRDEWTIENLPGKRKEDTAPQRKRALFYKKKSALSNAQIFSIPAWFFYVLFFALFRPISFYTQRVSRRAFYSLISA